MILHSIVYIYLYVQYNIFTMSRLKLQKILILMQISDFRPRKIGVNANENFLKTAKISREFKKRDTIFRKFVLAFRSSIKNEI